MAQLNQHTAWIPTLEDVIRGMNAVELSSYLAKSQAQALENGVAQTEEDIYDELKQPIQVKNDFLEGYDE